MNRTLKSRKSAEDPDRLPRIDALPRTLMRLIAVLDLLAGRAVHARGGRRDAYLPVDRVADRAIPPGDAVALARAYVDVLRVRELYAADLDAILGRPPNDALVASLAALGAPLWLDAAVTTPAGAARARTLGAARVIVGLETLAGFDALATICDASPPDSVAFSLDLRDGIPLGGAVGGTAQEHAPHDFAAHELAARAADAGVGAVIVLDLARVGTERGLDLALLARVRGAVPGVLLLAGGGVRGPDDLARLADAGCDGALVASALLDGRLGAADVAAWSRVHPDVRRNVAD